MGDAVQKTTEPASSIPPNDDGATQAQTKRYTFRETTLHARPALPDLPRPRQTQAKVTACPSSSAPMVLDEAPAADEAADPMEEIADIQKSLRAEDAQWTNSLPMPHVKKIARTINLMATIGRGKPSSSKEASGLLRSASDEVRAGSKRNIEGVSDADNTRSPKLIRSASVSNDNTESTSNSLRRSVSGTVLNWRANRTPSPPQSHGAVASSRRQPHHDYEEDRQSQFGEEEEEEVEVEVGQVAEVEGEEEIEEDPEDLIDDDQLMNESENKGDALRHGVVVTAKEVYAKTKKNADKLVRSSHILQDGDSDAIGGSNAKRKLAAHGCHPPAPAPARSSQPVSSAAGMQGDHDRRPPAPATTSSQPALAATARGDYQTKRRAGYYSRGEKARRRLAQIPIRVQQAEQTSGEIQLSSGERPSWTIERLPKGTDLDKWNVFVVPRFLRYFACFGEPWDANIYLDYAQKLWEIFFPESSHILTPKQDAVYPLLRQHVYDFRSGFAERAERAVEDFFKRYSRFAEPARIEEYVQWAVPPARVKANRTGQTIMLEDHVFPYMYRYNHEHRMDGNDALKGSFQHECILNAFAHYLEVVNHFPSPTVRTDKPPRIALALATVAVERALKQWSTGWFEPDTAKFSAAEWGAETHDLLMSINGLSEAKWKRIICEAHEYIERYKKLGTFKANFTRRVLSRQPSGRAIIITSDEEDPDDRTASDASQ
ncbi:hypothetical protein F5887DRAFT_1083303 [Amanita rubescens]|nr:hypothetical protein F5887DRAFT_1083303 [Amanita rubescens]